MGLGSGSNATIAVRGGFSVAAVGTIEDSDLRATIGAIDSGLSSLDVRRTTISGGRPGMWAGGAGINAEDVVVNVGDGGIAMLAQSSGGHNASLTARHVTTVGGDASSTGASVQSDGANSATLTLKESVIRQPGTALQRSTAGAAAATLTADHNDYHPSATVLESGAGVLSDTNRRTDDPRFLDEAGGDLRLRFDSPMIDAGDPADSLGVSESATDRNGGARIVDGDGNGAPVRDLGAHEYQRRPPAVTAAATPAAAVPGSPFSWTAAAVDPDGDPLTFGWAWDDGVTAAGGTASHGFLSLGQHTGTVTAHDATGLTASSSAGVDVTAARDTTPPVFAIVSRKLRLTPKNTVTVRMSCGRAEPEACAGRVKLASVKKVNKHRVLKLGSALFGINPGRSRNIKIKVPRHGARVVRRLHKLKVSVMGVARDTAGNKATVRRRMTLTAARRRR
jgi:hypothetical protein